MTENIAQNSEEISLREIALKFKEWLNYLSKRWVIISFFGLVGGLSGFFYASIQKSVYIAKVTFIVEEGKGASSGLGGLASLAGQFGVDFGGSSQGGILSGDNILLYFKSPSLAREVLLTKFNGDSLKSIADEYAKVYGLTEKWEKNDKVGKINFPILTSKTVYSRLQDSLLKEIIQQINLKQFSVARTDKKAGFIEVSSAMENELLAKTYSERIVKKVVERYVNLKTERQYSTVQNLQSQVDSIANLLRQKTFSGAALQNSSSTMDINPLYKTGTSVATETTLRDKALLTTIFATVTQNLELAKFTLSQETPVIQIVDTPILPLKIEKMSRLKLAIIGSLLFGFILVLGIILKRLYTDLIVT